MRDGIVVETCGNDHRQKHMRHECVDQIQTLKEKKIVGGGGGWMDCVVTVRKRLLCFPK